MTPRRLIVGPQLAEAEESSHCGSTKVEPYGATT